MDEKQVLEKLDRIREIPTLPSIVFELNKQLQDPDASVARISKNIEKVQAMALKILKLVNSAFYGLTSKISDIRNAVVLLGFNAADDLLARFEEFNLVAVLDGHFHGFTERHLGATVLTTNRCCAISRDNHDGTKEKGCILCTAENGRVTRQFVEVHAPKQ